MEAKSKMTELYCDEIASAVQLMRAGVGKVAVKTPVLLHCSDIHNSERAINRILTFSEECDRLITDIVHAGDSVASRICQGMSAFNIPGAE